MTPDSPAGAFTAHVIAAAAELERALIRERTKEALHAARAKGIRLGRPPAMSRGAVERIRELHDGGMRVAEIARTLNREEVPTSTGRGVWHPPGITRALRVPDAA